MRDRQGGPPHFWYARPTAGGWHGAEPRLTRPAGGTIKREIAVSAAGGPGADGGQSLAGAGHLSRATENLIRPGSKPFDALPTRRRRGRRCMRCRDKSRNVLFNHLGLGVKTR
jgi:hypothetical protein